MFSNKGRAQASRPLLSVPLYLLVCSPCGRDRGGKSRARTEIWSCQEYVPPPMSGTIFVTRPASRDFFPRDSGKPANEPLPGQL